ncbi:hypothetical protein AMJ83_02150 [candidate division WOR_3 bacterium SM23_42]|uniref:Lipopolysaccharide assembly protein A domain-containing protein n=1 Tax=candidate division WOR_3 bacterium SM23_42 TaxID=1703779 RepID=A0A0S8FW19_UNCW3|nr:MAG: hypothetical protein AMJ83_02150 [candidate division WOR_3 bacterium SM23_42]
MKAKGIIIIILTIIALILIVQNTEIVPLQLLFWRVWMSRIVMIVLMLAIGFGIGYVLAAAGRKKPKQ